MIYFTVTREYICQFWSIYVVSQTCLFCLYKDLITHVVVGKYLADLTAPRAGSKPRAHRDPASFVRTEIGGRQSRPDYMAHYPFADDSGTVPDILHGPATSGHRLLEMGAPARKRLVARVFEEMRFSKVGLRLSDIPEALDVSWLAF